jgi:hypothetical protein
MTSTWGSHRGLRSKRLGEERPGHVFKHDILLHQVATDAHVAGLGLSGQQAGTGHWHASGGAGRCESSLGTGRHGEGGQRARLRQCLEPWAGLGQAT